MERFAGYLKKITADILENSSKLICDIEIIPEEEKHRLLVVFNDTAAQYPHLKRIHELFGEQVERTPYYTALVGKEEAKKRRGEEEKKQESPFGRINVFAWGHLSYRELNYKADLLAHLLIEKVVQPDTIVGIMMERTVEMIIGILAILKAGGAYLPIDPGYPQERIDFMLKDSGTKVLVTTGNLAQEGETVRRWEGMKNLEIVFLENLSLPNFLTSRPPNSPLLPATGSRQLSTSLAYIIYTSGSTGKPKGTMAEHRSLGNACHWQARYYNITARDHAAQYASFVFDAFVLEIFPCLLQGASLHIIADEIRPNLGRLSQYYEKIGITIGFLPTQVAERFMNWRIVRCEY